MSDRALDRFDFDPDRLEVRLERTIPGTAEAVSPVVEEILAIIRDSGCTHARQFEVELALLEAVGNAVSHGCKLDPTRRVEVCVACQLDHGTLIVVRDPGEGFDPSDLPNPVEGDRLLATSGRGIFLINHLMDEVHFENGGTEIWMLKRA